MARKTFRKVITDPEKWKNVNPKNKKLMVDFLNEKNTRSSDLTIKGYESDLRIFFTWNLDNNNNKFFVDLKKLEVSLFFSYCVEELKWGSARFGRMRSALSSMSIFIEKFLDDKYPDFRNVILKSIDVMPKTVRREKTILSEGQINGLLLYLIKKKMYQQACWLALAVASGSRFAELLRFMVSDIDETNLVFDDIFIETSPIKTKGRTKEGKLQRKYVIKDIFLKYFHAWLPERNKIILKNNVEDHGYIFIKSDGSPMTQGAVRGWVRLFEKYLGGDFYPHCLRHYLVTYLSRTGVQPDLIIELMGWTSSEMYKIYNDLSAKDREWEGLKDLKLKLAEK